jgi:putative membrane protein
MMSRLVIRWFILVLALFVANWLVAGIEVQGDAWGVFAASALILGLVNALIRPLLRLLSCSLIVVTLGLFSLLINGFCLWLASQIAVRLFHVGFHVHGFWAAFWGGVVISLVQLVLSWVFRDQNRKPKQKD